MWYDKRGGKRNETDYHPFPKVVTATMKSFVRGSLWLLNFLLQSKLIKLLHPIFFAGTQGLQEEYKKRTVVTVNTLAAITGLMVFGFGLYYYTLAPVNRLLFGIIVEGSCFWGLVLLNKYGKYNYANIGMFAIHFFSAFYFGALLAEGLKIEFVFAFLLIFLTGASFFLYLKMSTRIVCGIATVALLFSVYANYHYQWIKPLHFPPAVLPIVKWCALLGMCVIILIVIFSFMYLKDRLFLEKDKLIQEKDALIKEKDRLIKEKDQLIAEKDNLLSEIRRLLKEKDELLIALKRAIGYKEKFLWVVSHELRNALHAIVGNAEQLYFKRMQYSPETRREIEDLYRGALLIKEIVNHVLDTAQMESGKLYEIKKESINLQEIVEICITQNRVLANRKGIDIELLFDGQLAMINGDVVVMTKIVNNLLSNASKYAEPNSVITIEVVLRNNLIIFRVGNDGEIDPKLGKTIFEPFVSERNTVESTGLGLSLTKEFVELYGGKIKVNMGKRGERKRTIFTVHVPYEPAPKFKRKRLVDDNFSLAGRKLLVFEDDTMALNLIKNYIKKTGADFVCYDQVKSVDSAIEIIEHEEPDVIVSDIVIPGMNSKDLFFKLGKLEKLKDIPFVFMTGGQRDVSDLRKREGRICLLKPFQYEEFCVALANCIKSKFNIEKIDYRENIIGKTNI